MQHTHVSGVAQAFGQQDQIKVRRENELYLKRYSLNKRRV